VNNAGEISYTIRYPAALHKQLKFLAVDRDLSLNKLIISVLAREVQAARVPSPMNG
jgi:predicted HicB family RNase H-like nuclease